MLKRIINIGAIVIALILVTGCGQPKPAKMEVLNLDKIQSGEASKKVNKTIIVLKAAVKMINTENSKRMDMRSQIIRMREGITGGDYDFNKAYSYKYGSRASNALKNDISDILLNEGFTVNTDYDSYDDIDFAVKKSAYLVVQPEIEASFMTSGVKKDKSGSTLTENGYVSLTGTIKITNFEPLSKVSLATKKISLDELRINKPYTSIRKVETNHSYTSAFGLGKAAGGAIGGMIFGSSELDNTENTLVSIVNEVHSHAITKLISRFQQANLLAYEDDILEIKSKKRY